MLVLLLLLYICVYTVCITLYTMLICQATGLSPTYHWKQSHSDTFCIFDDENANIALMCYMIMESIETEQVVFPDANTVGSICMMACISYNHMSRNTQCALWAIEITTNVFFRRVFSAIDKLLTYGANPSTLFSTFMSSMKIKLDPCLVVSYIAHYSWDRPIREILQDSKIRRVVISVLLRIHSDLSDHTTKSGTVSCKELHSFISFEYARDITEHTYPSHVKGISHSTVEAVLRNFDLIGIGLSHIAPDMAKFITDSDNHIKLLRSARLLPSVD